jgi:DNA repair protein RecO (recombination protein O)
VSEAIVLRTYPLQEADLIVSFLTRDQGKLRGVARRARRLKSPFGSALERLSQVRITYFQRETRELVNLDSCDLLVSQFPLLSDYRAGVALDYFAEITEQLLPPSEPNERFFRLLNAVLENLRSEQGGLWRAVTYFSLWAARLAGFLPDLTVCFGCGALLSDQGVDEAAFFLRGRHGLVCSHCSKSAGSPVSQLTAESRRLAAQMLRKPVAQIDSPHWPRQTCTDLRRFLVQQIETHIERQLLTAPILEAD